MAQLVGTVALELVLGVLSGLLIGFGGAWILRRIALPASGLYPIAVLCLAFLAYGGAAAIHGSGFAAIYIAALILGNSELPHRAASRSFAEGIAWLAQIGLFVMLGLLLSPGRITLSTIGLAVSAGLILTFVARPLSVLVSSVVQPMPWRELAFISWAGLRGAVPIVLTTIPLAAEVDGATRLFDLVFVMVVIYTLLTGPTLPLAARWLRVARRSEPRGLEVEAAPLEKVAADLLQVTISPRSRMHGVEVGELRLPTGASVSLVIREGRALVPEPRTALRTGDDLVVVTPRKQREATEKRLRQVASGGRLAAWLDDYGHRLLVCAARRTADEAGLLRGRRLLALDELLEALAHHDDDPQPQLLALDDGRPRAEEALHQPDRRAQGVAGPDLGVRHRRTPRRVAVLTLGEALVEEQLGRAAGQPGA